MSESDVYSRANPYWMQSVSDFFRQLGEFPPRSMVWLRMPMRCAIVGVRRSEFYIDQIENTVADPALGDDLICEFSDAFHRPL